MEKKKIEKKKKIFLEHLDYYDEKFSFKQIPLYRNKKKITFQLKKINITNTFSLWYDLPYSLLIFVPNLKTFHHMQNYFYSLKEGFVIKKHRRVYKKDYTTKIITSFECYRIYCDDLLKLYNWIEEMVEYNIIILGLEIHNYLYPLEALANYLKTIKLDLNYFYTLTQEFNKEFNQIYNNLNQLDKEFNQNLKEIFTICQHIIKLDEVKE